MSAKILVYLSARRVSLGIFAQGRLTEVRSFPNDDMARRALAELLATRVRTPVYLMADVADEDFRSETLPHVMGRARAEMVARKLMQYFRASPYRAAWRQGRSEGRSEGRGAPAGRRRDDQYLFMALNNSELLRPYLELVEAYRAPLAGIYLLPAVSQILVERLKSFAAGALLVSLQGGGLRQSFFLDGRLRMSRLSSLEVLDGRSLEQALAEEVEKSRLFLYNSRQFSREELLQVWVLDSTGELRDVCASMPKEALLSCEVLGREALLKVFGMMAESDLPQDMDALMLCLLGRHAPEGSLASPRQTRAYSHLRLRRGLHLAAAGLAVAAIFIGAYNLYAYSAYQERNAVAFRETADLRARYEEAARSFPRAPTSAENMRKAVETVNALRASERTPEAAMRAAGQVLMAYPGITLNKFSWHVGRVGNASDVEEGELSAEIRPFDGDYRSALRLIEEFATSLRKQPGVVQVQVLELPVNLDSKTSLTGNTQDAPNAGTAIAQFKLSLRMGPAG